MRKVLISIAAAASALTIAAPASAQWHAPTYRYAPYNYAYGYNGVQFARSMQARVQRIRYDVRAMQSRRIVSFREARSLDNQARRLERRIYRAPRNGVRAAEARRIEREIRQLERRVAREARDWNGRPRR